MFDRKTVFFYASDILSLDGEDLTSLPLIERKCILDSVVEESASTRLLYVDFIHEQGEALFEMICARDMEGIVAKPQQSPYGLLGGKIKNKDDSQTKGRSKIFNR